MHSNNIIFIFMYPADRPKAESLFQSLSSRT